MTAFAGTNFLSSPATQFAVEVLRNGIKASMDAHYTGNGTNEVQQAVYTVARYHRSPVSLLYEDTQHCQGNACSTGIDNHLSDIELQAPSCRGSSAGNQDTDKFDDLAGHDGVKEAKTGYHLNKGASDATPCMDRHMHHQLDNQKNVNQ